MRIFQASLVLVRYSTCDLKASHQKRKGKGEIKALKERNAFFSTQTKHQIRLHCHKEQIETRKVMASMPFVLSGTRDTQGVCVPKTHLFELLRLYNCDMDTFYWNILEKVFSSNLYPIKSLHSKILVRIKVCKNFCDLCIFKNPCMYDLKNQIFNKKNLTW